MVNSNYKTIIKSTSIVGASSIVMMLLGMFKIKYAAFVIGPLGVGLIGLLLNLVNTVAVLFGIGLSTSGVKLIAESKDDKQNLSKYISSILLILHLLGAIGAGGFYLFYHFFERYFINLEINCYQILILSCCIMLSISSSSFLIILNGQRKIKLIALLNILVSAFAAFIGILTIKYYNMSGVIWFVMAAPFFQYLIGFYLVWVEGYVSFNFDKIKEVLTKTLSLGLLFMIAGFVGLLFQLGVRFLVSENISIDALGYYQAGWTISMTYVGLVLGAMSVDYFPRLSEAFKNNELINTIINDQIGVATLLSGPIILVLLSVSNYIVVLLYSESFIRADGLLKWHLLGDILKIASWPIGYVLLAKNKGKVYFLSELVTFGLYFVASYYFSIYFGLIGVGAAFFLMYFFYIFFISNVVRKICEFRWQAHTIKTVLFFLTLALTLVIFKHLEINLIYKIIFNLIIIFLSVWYSLSQLKKIGGISIPNLIKFIK